MEFNKTQWNGIFEVVVKAGLSPSLFNRHSQPSDGTTGATAAVGLRVKDNQTLYFVCDIRGQDYFYQYYPNRENVSYKYHTHRWNEVFENLLEWVTCVKGELEAPDLWTAADNIGEAWHKIDWGKRKDDHFSTDEIKLISSALDETKLLVAHQLLLNAKQAKEFDSKIDELKSGLGEIKRSWLMPLLFGILIQFIVPVQPAQDKMLTVFTQVGQRVADCIVEGTITGEHKPSPERLPK